MQSVVIPKKFEIRFRLTGENQYTGALLIDGMQMGVGAPKNLEEIVAFLMPQGIQKVSALDLQDQADT